MQLHEVILKAQADAREANPVQLKRVKVLTSYSAHARFLLECGERILGEIPTQIHQPYRFGSTHSVHNWKGTPVIIAETKHRRYEVFEVVSGRIEQVQS